MNKEKHDFFLHSNEVNHISKENYDKIELLVNATKAFARSTYQCVYIIDYFHQDFIYASDNLAYLCGLEPEQLMEAGYQMYIEPRAGCRPADAARSEQEGIRPFQRTARRRPT